jgi:integrase
VKDRPLQVDIRDRRLLGSKRLRLSAGTRNKRVRAQYVADIRTLLDGGFLDEVERVRRGEITLATVRRAVREADYTLLKPQLDGVLTLGKALDRVLSKVEANGVEGTAKEYRVIAGQLKEHFSPDRELSSITSDEALTWLQSEKETTGSPWSPGRQAVVRAILGRVWGDEIRRDHELARKRKATPRVTDNPWRSLKLPRVRQTRFTFLTGEQWRRVVDKNRGTPAMAYLALCCLAGLRQMEAGHLRVSDDIDLDAGTLRIQSRDGEWPWRPKTERSERVVPIGAELRTLLAGHIEAGFSGQRYLLVLPYRDQPISPPTLAKWCRLAFQAAEIPYGRDAASLTTHSLRHTFASWLVQRDVSPLKVAELIGDTPEMVLRVYGHLAPRDLSRAVTIIDDVAREG